MRRMTVAATLLLLAVVWSQPFAQPALCRYFGLYQVEPSVVMPVHLPQDPRQYLLQWKEERANSLHNLQPDPYAIGFLRLPRESEADRHRVVGEWMKAQLPQQAWRLQATAAPVTPEGLREVFPDFESLSTTLVADFFHSPERWGTALCNTDTARFIPYQLRPAPLPPNVRERDVAWRRNEPPEWRAQHALTWVNGGLRYHMVGDEAVPEVEDWRWWAVIVW